jgi:RNA ligase
MTIQNTNELASLAEMIANGYIVKRQHPTFPIAIYNYTAKAQYENVWNEATLTCRGLICDIDGNVVARPFRKFFNLEQVESLPDEPFDVYEKLDGSLGILYWWDGKPYIATRGSFDSEQAVEANKMLANYDTEWLDKRFTYLFEIIYPENRIVVDYGESRKLVLLAMISTQDGKEVSIYENVYANLGMFPLANKLFGVTYPQDLKKIERSNFEGFVLRFQSGLRVKVKTSEYVRLHKLLTGISEKRILEDYLMQGRSIDELLERVPDEFNAWLRDVVEKYTEQYKEIESKALGILYATSATTRKEYAQIFTKTHYASILFLMLDSKSYSQQIWKMIKPSTKTFHVDSEQS